MYKNNDADMYRFFFVCVLVHVDTVLAIELDKSELLSKSRLL